MKRVKKDGEQTHTNGIRFKVFKRYILVTLEIAKKKGDWFDGKFIGFSKYNEEGVKGFSLSVREIGLFFAWRRVSDDV